MMDRVLSVASSAVILGLAAALGARAVAELESQSYASTEPLLASATGSISRELARGGDDLPELAAQLANDATLAPELRQLTNVVSAAAATRKPSDAVRTKIETLTAKLRDHAGQLRAGEPTVSAVVLVNEAGNVLVSESERYTAGQSLAAVRLKPAPRVAPPADDTGGVVPPLPPLREKAAVPLEPGPLDPVFADGRASGLATQDGALYYWGAAPIRQKGKVAGAVLVERKLESLPSVAGVEAFLFIDGTQAFGQAPEGFAPDAERSGTFLLTPAELPGGLFFSSSLMRDPLFAADPRPGTFAQRFALERAPAVVGYVSTDVAPRFVAVAAAQRQFVWLAVALWLAHGLLIAAAGLRLELGLRALTRHLGAMRDHEEVALDEARYPRAMRELVRLVGGRREPEEMPSASVGASEAPSAIPGAAPSAETSAVIEHEGELRFQAIAEGSSFGKDDAAQPDGIGLDEPTNPRLVAFSHDFDGPPSTGAQPVASEGRADAAVDAEPVTKAEPAANAEPAIHAEPVRAIELASKVEPVTEAEPVSEAEAVSEADPVTEAEPVSEAEPVINQAESTGSSEPKPTPAVEAATSAASAVISGLGTSVSLSTAAPDQPAEHAIAGTQSGRAAKGATAMAPATPSTWADAANSTAVISVTPELLAAIESQAKEEATKEASSAATPASPKLEEGWRQVYEDFLAARKQCGEAGELAFEKFTTRLEETRAAVMAKHNCKDVSFQVYVKNGRAALRAVPAR